MNTLRRRPYSSAILAISLSISGCSRAEPAASLASEPSRPEPAAPAAASSPKASVGGTRAEPVTPGHLVISEAELSIRTAAPERMAEEVSRDVVSHGGFVVKKEAERSDEAVLRVDMVVRVPSSAFEATLGELRHRGTVLKESASGNDVTEEFTDTNSELRAKRKLEERLLGIVEASKTVKDMLEVENELGRVRADIEKLEGHARYLSDRAAFATIHASFVSPTQPIAEDDESVGSRLRNAVAQAKSVFVSVTAGLIVALGAVSPALIPAGLLVLAARRRRRRLALALGVAGGTNA